MKKIISWNVASIRARMDLLKQMLTEQNPDIVFLQEIKIQEEQFPFFDLLSLGYHAVISGQKAWNGVAILSKEPLSFVSSSLSGFEDQARFVEAQLSNGTSLISVYVPNGQAPANNPFDTSRLEYKLKWMKALYNYLSGKENFIVGGDFNVIYKDEDVYNPELFTDSALMVAPVRTAFKELLSLPIENPLRDFNLDKPFYTFWDFQGGAWQKNHGIFLDYIFLSEPFFEKKIIKADVLKEYRSCPKPSDHAPIIVEFE
ncbi:MAG: exodeoxyribonuclease III [Alphaproteobacteria bacterium]|nr:exodeoxyribonuclease III [Alphaproteobacteria bacterium]